MSARDPKCTSDQTDPRGIWQGITTLDGLTIEGSQLDGFHVRRDGLVLASYYRGEAGTGPLAALTEYRELEQRGATDTQTTTKPNDH